VILFSGIAASSPTKPPNDQPFVDHTPPTKAKRPKKKSKKSKKAAAQTKIEKVERVEEKVEQVVVVVRPEPAARPEPPDHRPTKRKRSPIPFSSTPPANKPAAELPNYFEFR
jgi:hypothetical protein